MIKNQRLFWKIVDQLQADIDSGKYRVGSRLPPERELAEIFNVSRPTVREAIIALEVLGKVEVKTGSGVYVIHSAQTTETEEKINAFELTQARALIEGEVAALAAVNITDEELEKLHETLVSMETGGDIDAADRDFHRIISKATRNGAIQMTVKNLWSLRSSSYDIIKDYESVCGNSNELTLAEHTAIYNALKSRDSAAARNAMHSHFNRLINALFDAMETKALEEIKRKNDEKRGLYSIDRFVRNNIIN
jgi:DNA-binding FadR family transcriptional regulator